MPLMKKLIIFDLDGTIIDSANDLADSINKMLIKLNRSTYDTQTIKNWIGNGASALVKRALVGKKDYLDSDIDEKYFKIAKKTFLDIYKNNLTNKTTLYKGSKELIENLHHQNKILAIVTNKPKEFVKPILKHFELEHFFDTYLGGNSLKTKKPNPQPLLYILNKYNIKKDEAIMVGDSKNDIEAANNANIDSIAITHGYNYDEDISKYNPTYIVKNFKELQKILT